MCREFDVKKVIYSSTSSGYGNNECPNVETQSDDCLNPYSVSKIAGEKLCKMYSDFLGYLQLFLDTLMYMVKSSPKKVNIVRYGIFLSWAAINYSWEWNQRDFVYVGCCRSEHLGCIKRY